MQPTTAPDLFREQLTKPESELDLGVAGLVMAVDEYPLLDWKDYVRRMDEMANQVRKNLPLSSPQPSRFLLESLNNYLFVQLGFCGNLTDYSDPRNSYLHEVLDRRTGIPITLSLLYMEIAQRLGLTLQGIGMPGHFLLKCPEASFPFFIDPFHGGEFLTPQLCRERMEQVCGTQVQFQPCHLEPVSKKQILHRMLMNLKAVYINREEHRKALATVNKILLVVPEAAVELRDRGLLHFQLNQFAAAIRDWRRYLEAFPEAADSLIIRRNLNIAGEMLSFRN